MDVTAIQTMKSYLRKQKVLELVHLWLPQTSDSALDLTLDDSPTSRVWCLGHTLMHYSKQFSN